jgi:hypothetical protein
VVVAPFLSLLCKNLLLCHYNSSNREPLFSFADLFFFFFF